MVLPPNDSSSRAETATANEQPTLAHGTHQKPNNNGTSHANDNVNKINKSVLQDLRLVAVKARWDQSSLGFDSSSTDGRTVTHADTTEYSNSVYDGEGEPQRKKRKMATPSVYSYNSTRDISQFVKDVNGRCEKKLASSALCLQIADLVSLQKVQHVERFISPSQWLVRPRFRSSLPCHRCLATNNSHPYRRR